MQLRVSCGRMRWPPCVPSSFSERSELSVAGHEQGRVKSDLSLVKSAPSIDRITCASIGRLAPWSGLESEDRAAQRVGCPRFSVSWAPPSLNAGHQTRTLQPAAASAHVSSSEALPSPCRARTWLPVFGRAIAPDESDALAHLRGRVLPVVLVFNGDVAVEVLVP